MSSYEEMIAKSITLSELADAIELMHSAKDLPSSLSSGSLTLLDDSGNVYVEVWYDPEGEQWLSTFWPEEVKA